MSNFGAATSKVGPMPFGLGVACGERIGWANIEKFGHCDDVDTGSAPADVWGGADPDLPGTSIYTFSSTAVSYYISSADGSDTQDIVVVGLTEDGNGDWNEETVTVTLAGQTKTEIVSGSGDPWIRVYRAYNTGSTVFAGNVYVYEDDTVIAGVPQTDSLVRAVVVAGDDQTEMCVYTVPNSVVINGVRETVDCAVFVGGYVGIARSSATASVAEFTWRARSPGSVFAVKGRIECQNRGSGYYSYLYPTGGISVVPKTDVVMRCELVSANNTGVVGAYSIQLKTTRG